MAAAAGMICFHLSIGDILMTYVMPIMGWWKCSGALPMSSIYEEVTEKTRMYITALRCLH